MVKFEKSGASSYGEVCSTLLMAELNWATVGIIGMSGGSEFQWTMVRGKKEYLYPSVVACICLYARECEHRDCQCVLARQSEKGIATSSFVILYRSTSLLLIRRWSSLCQSNVS